MAEEKFILKSFVDLIDLWPGPQALAKATDRSTITIRGWRHRNGIPDEGNTRERIIALAEEWGYRGVTKAALNCLRNGVEVVIFLGEPTDAQEQSAGGGPVQ